MFGALPLFELLDAIQREIEMVRKMKMAREMVIEKEMARRGHGDSRGKLEIEI
jgi:hypothetical protein